MKFDEWPKKNIGNFFYTTSSFVHHFKSIGEFKLDLQSRNAQFGSKLVKYYPHDLVIWWMTLENNRAPLLSNIKLYVSFHHQPASTFVQHFVPIGELKLELQPETPNLGQIRQFLEPCDLQIWWMTLQNNRAPLLRYFKLCAAFRTHWWIQT